MHIFGNKFDQHNLNVNPNLEDGLKDRLDRLGPLPGVGHSASLGAARMGLVMDLTGQSGNSASRSRGFSQVGNKPHVLTHNSLPGWLIKRERHDEVGQRPFFRPDTNIYRIRSAKKIGNVLAKNGDERFFTVPKKYLCTMGNEQVVVAERMQGEALKPSDKFTVEQAQALTRLITQAGLIDINPENFLKRGDGKIAIIDTEPLARGAKKADKRSILSCLLGRFAVLDVTWKTEAFTNLARFSCPEALPIIEQAQRRHMWKQVAFVVAKIAIGAILLAGVIMGSPVVATTALALKAAAICTLYLKVYLSIRLIDLLLIPVVIHNTAKSMNAAWAAKFNE